MPVELINEKTTYDARLYVELLAETCNSVTEPFGFEIDIRKQDMTENFGYYARQPLGTKIIVMQSGNAMAENLVWVNPYQCQFSICLSSRYYSHVI